MLDDPSMSSATCSPGMMFNCIIIVIFSNICFLLLNIECVSLIKEKLVSTIGKGKDEVAGFAHFIAIYIVFGKAVSNTKSNLNDAQSKYFSRYLILFKVDFIYFNNYICLLFYI